MSAFTELDKKTDIQQVEDAGNWNSDQDLKSDAKVMNISPLQEALQENKIKPWSKESMHLYFAIFITFCCSCANGYDGSLLSGMLPMPYFQSTFQTGTTGPKVSLIACMYTVGQITGAPFGAILSDRYGRKKTMAAGAWLIIIGMIIAVAGANLGSFTAGRFVLGFGITLCAMAAPAYTMEIAPPHWRGRCTGLYNCGWFGGSIPAAAVTYGCNYINSNWSWRVPLILQAFACTFVVIGVWWVPESPRWLMANGREDEAFEILAKYHGGGDMNAKLVQLQIVEFKESITTTGSDKTWWDYRVLFKTHNARWRTVQVVLMSVAGQYSGNGLGYFNSVIYENLGITSVNQQLAYNLLYAVISAIGALIGALLSDRMPRRKVLVFGTFACACWLAINAALQSVMDTQGASVSPSVSKGALAAYLLFSFNFMFTYTPLQAVVPTEALETTTRAKGLALSNMITGAMGFLNQFAGPIALENIGYKYVYVFVGWDVVESGLWYFFGVEAQGRTLEELEWVYNQPNPVKASLKPQKVVVTDDGRVMGIDEL